MTNTKFSTIVGPITLLEAEMSNRSFADLRRDLSKSEKERGEFKCTCGYTTNNSTDWCIHADGCTKEN